MADDQTPTRIGFLVDGNPDTELLSALYEFDALGVRVKVPYLADADHHSRWWSHGVMFMDDVHRTKYDYSPPTEFDYYDSEGSVALIGCQSGRGKERFGGTSPAVGVGVINARYAVEGACTATHYLKPNGFRSEMDGLGNWLGYSAISSIVKYKKDGDQSYEVSTTAKQVEAMSLARSMNLRAVARAIRSGNQTAEVTYRSSVFLETFMKSGRDWDEHLALHKDIRSLLRIAAWKPINFQSHEVASLKETVTIEGEEKRTWPKVRTAVTGLAPSSWSMADRFLFTYSDIGRVGLGKWLKLVNDYSRGIDPFVRLLDLEGATIDARMSQLGIAVEAMGYQSLIDSGHTPTAANKVKVKERIDHLLDEVAGTYTFDTTFAQDFTDSYNSVKHANRAVVPPQTKLDHYREGVRLLRAWVAVKVGMPASVVAIRW